MRSRAGRERRVDDGRVKTKNMLEKLLEQIA
jgi:hypothetical protein